MWEPSATASTFVELQSTWLGEVAKTPGLKVTHQVEVIVVPDVRGVQDSLRSLVNGDITMMIVMVDVTVMIVMRVSTCGS